MCIRSAHLVSFMLKSEDVTSNRFKNGKDMLLFYEILFLFSFSMLSFTHRNNISIKPLPFLLFIKDSIQDARKEEELDDVSADDEARG